MRWPSSRRTNRLSNSGASSVRKMSLLLLEAARGQHAPRVLAVQAGEQVSGADEAAEQAEAVEAAGKARDATAPEQVGPLPVGEGGVVEMAAQVPVVGVDIGARVGGAEEAQERRVVGQVSEGGELELVEGDVGGVEVDGDDALGIAGEVAHHVAAARGDGDDARLRGELQRFQVDARVLPDLRIDEAAEGEREGALMQAGQREGAAAMNRFAQQLGARAGRCIDEGVHEEPFGWSAAGSDGRRKQNSPTTKRILIAGM